MTRRAWAVAVVLGLVAVPAASGQPRPASDASPFLEGTHAFRHILYDVAGGRMDQLTPLRTAEAAAADPAHTLVVVLGQPWPLNDLERMLRTGTGRQEIGLRSFVQRGGALFVATDLATPGPLVTNFGVEVDGTRLSMAVHRERAYREMEDCPFIDPQVGADPPLFQGLPAFRGVPARRVASNVPSHLVYRRIQDLRMVPLREPLPLLASLPPECTDGLGNFGPWDFAVGGGLGNGRVLIMADHSVLINGMMLQSDNDNIDFAYRCARWLETGPVGRRDKILYYEDGLVRTDFDLPLKNLPLPVPPPATLLDMADQTLHGMEEDGTFQRMEDENFFNGLVEDGVNLLPLAEGTTPARKIGLFALVAASLALGLYGFVRLGTFRQRVDLTAPALAALLPKEAVGGGVLEQRQEALLRDGNLGEAARALARSLFAAGGVLPELAPPIAVNGGWWRRLARAMAVAVALAPGSLGPAGACLRTRLHAPGGPGGRAANGAGRGNGAD